MPLELAVLDPPLDDIANRHDPHQLPALDNGHMAEPAFGHHLHQILGLVGEPAGPDLAGHDLVNPRRECPPLLS